MNADMGTLEYRMGEVERDHRELCVDVEQIRSTVTRHEEQISGAGGLIKAMQNLSDKVDSLNRALYTFALSFIVAAVGIAVSIGVH